MGKSNLESLFKEQTGLLSVFFRGVDPTAANKIKTDTFYLFYNDNLIPSKPEDLTKAIKEKTKESIAVEIINVKEDEEKYSIFLNSKLIYTSNYPQTKLYVDSIIKMHFGVLEAREIDVKKLIEWNKPDPDISGRIIAYAIGGVTVCIIVAFVVSFIHTKNYEYLKKLAVVFFVLVGIYFLILRNIDTLYGLKGGSKYQEEYSKPRALFMQKKYEEAIREFKRVIAEEPNAYEPRYKYCLMLEEMKRYKEALLEYEKLYNMTKNREFAAFILQHIAEMHIEVFKDKEKAKHYLNKVVREYGETKAGERAKLHLEKLP